MKSFKNYIPFFIILISVGAFISCRDDDNNNQEVEDVFAACCSGLTAFGEDVDNLDQSQGEIVVENLFTPNGDAFNDLFGIENIGLYDNHTVTIYNMNDDVIFESTNYGSNLNEYFPNVPYGNSGVEGIPDGTYKYMIVVENEQTFKKSGFFCLYTNNPPLEQQNFADCNPLEPGEFDPLITGN